MTLEAMDSSDKIRGLKRLVSTVPMRDQYKVASKVEKLRRKTMCRNIIVSGRDLLASLMAVCFVRGPCGQSHFENGTSNSNWEKLINKESGLGQHKKHLGYRNAMVVSNRSPRFVPIISSVGDDVLVVPHRHDLAYHYVSKKYCQSTDASGLVFGRNTLTAGRAVHIDSHDNLSIMTETDGT